MKVALLSYLFDPFSGGGAPRSAYFLAQGLRKSGLEVVVITTHVGGDAIDNVDGLRVHRISPRNLYWVGDQNAKPAVSKVAWQFVDFWNPFVYQAVLRLLRDEKPDIVHVQKLRGLSPSVWAAARMAGVTSIVQTCRDYELVSPDAMLRGFVGQLAEQQSLLLRPYQATRAWMSNAVSAAVAPSRFTLDFLVERGFFLSGELKVIPNTPGYSTQQLAKLRRATHPPSSQFRILYIGRLEEIKGVADLCDVVESLVADFPHVELDVIGDGAEADGLRSRFGACRAIRFRGLLHGAEKENMLTNCSVLVIPSKWPEVFGNVIPEAYSFGKPVIGAAVGGIPELIEVGRTGLLFPSGDRELLREALVRFIIDPLLASRMRPACLDAAQRFAVDVVTGSHLALYQHLRETAVD